MPNHHDDDTAHDDRRAQGVVEQLQRQVAGVDIGVVRLEGKIETIGVQIQANVEQRERMEATLAEIAREFRLMNGRTRKNEDAIASLQHGHADFHQHARFMEELSRTLALQPDGTVSLNIPIRPQLSGKQKAVTGAIVVPLILGGLDLIRQGIELAIEFLKHGPVK
jgi:hypothetical protein